jgi:ArsR family transcriptional regulator, arsenate/arsenite/antimonite-responsive transcriptional repressor
MTTASLTLSDSAQLFRALGDENRLRIIAMLGAGERCVCDLQSDLEIGQSLLSFHLRVLREAGLVSDRRAGRWAFYSLRPEAVASIALYLGTLHERARILPVRDVCCD